MTAIKQSFVKLSPRLMIKNPVMFTVEIGTIVMLAVCYLANDNRRHYARRIMV